MIQIPKESFFGLDISIFEKEQLQKYVKERIDQKISTVFYGYSIGTIPYMIKVPKTVTIGNKFDVLLTDGRVLFLTCRLFGIKVKCDLSIPNFVHDLLRYANEDSLNIYLLGATNNTNNLAIDKIRCEYKKIGLCLGHHGYFKTDEMFKICEELKENSIDIVFIGISSPMKEEISLGFKKNNIAPIIVPCGGMIDVLAGRVKQTPTLLKKIGLASIFRVMQEPKRLYKRYLHIYSFLFFNLFPLLIFLFISRNKNFSLIKHYEVK